MKVYLCVFFDRMYNTKSYAYVASTIEKAESFIEEHSETSEQGFFSIEEWNVDANRYGSWDTVKLIHNKDCEW